MPDRTIEILTREGRPWRVDGAKFAAMQAAMMAVLPAQPPGMTVAQLKEALLPGLDADLFPRGDKAGWWIKAVQLDHEARGIIARAPGSPVRLYRA